MTKYLAALLCAGLMWSNVARAVTLVGLDAGFVTEAGGSAKGDGTITASAKYNYSVGREVHYSDGTPGSALAPMDRKNYFVFDLAGITDPITSATLTLWAGTLESVDATEAFGLFNPADPGGALALITSLASGTMSSEFDDPSDPHVGEAAMLHGNLTGGAMFLGGLVLTSADDDTFISITFTPAGLGYLNSFWEGRSFWEAASPAHSLTRLLTAHSSRSASPDRTASPVPKLRRLQSFRNPQPQPIS